MKINEDLVDEMSYVYYKFYGGRMDSIIFCGFMAILGHILAVTYLDFWMTNQ